MSIQSGGAHCGSLPHGVIVAGGAGRRLGLGPKHDVRLAGRSLLAHVRARIAPQVARLALNLNDRAPPDAADLPVLADLEPRDAGPLTGILRALEWGAAEGAAHVLTVPVDTPFLPRNLARALMEGSGGAAAYAASKARGHFICAIWPVSALDSFRTLVLESHIRRVDHMLDALDAAQVEFPGAPVDPFFNINTAEDLAMAEQLLAAHAPAP